MRKIRTGDTVIVITGKDKGKTGTVLRVDTKNNRIFVKDVNMQTKHKKQTRNQRSEIKHQEGPINISNVLYYDDRINAGTRVGFREEDGKKIRYAKKTGEAID